MLKILVIYGSVAPINTCGSIPNTKVLKYLIENDVDITLITCKPTSYNALDYSLIPNNWDKVRRFDIYHSRLFSKTLGAERERITNNGVKLKIKAETRPFRSIITHAIKDCFFRLYRIDWLYMAKKTVKKELKNEKFDLVFSSYPSSGAHFIAQYLMRKGYADKWIADFRDPMYYEHHDSHGVKSAKKMQHRFEKAADHITVVSEGAKSKFLFDDVPPEKITYIPNGYDPDDFSNEKRLNNTEEQKLRFFYAGTLYYGKRDLTPLLKAVRELADEGQIDISKVQFEYAGNEWAVMEQFAKEQSVISNCVNYGYVTREKVMEIMSEIDCSIVCSHNTKTDQGVVTGKIFELLLVEKPVVTIINGDLPNSELGKIVRQCNAGIVYEEANSQKDYEELKKWIKSAYDEKMQNGKITSKIDKAEREKYRYENITNELFELMCNITGKS